MMDVVGPSAHGPYPEIAIGGFGCHLSSFSLLFSNPSKMRTTAALLIACAFGATASATELQVNQYEGPT